MGRGAGLVRLVVAIALCWAALDATDVQAQTRADSAAVLLNAAEQLRLRGETGAARAVLELISQRYAGTPAAEDVARMMAVLRRTPDRERSGRTELLVFGTGYGAWLGVATPLALESDNAEAYGIGLLLGAPVGFFASKLYADAKNPTYGQTRALTFGGTWGTYMGIAAVELLEIGAVTETICPGEPQPCFEYEGDPDASAYVTSAVVGGLAGIGTGAWLARKPITAGTAATVTLGGMWGTWFGFALSYLADQRGDELLGGTVIGGNAALATLGFIAPRWEMSESRARLISVGGLVGGLAGAGLLLIAQPDDENMAITFPLVGSIAGLAAGTYWTRSRDEIPRDDGRGALLDGSGSGALLNRRDGRWALDVPDASLRFQHDAIGRRAAAAYVPLFSARF